MKDKMANELQKNHGILIERRYITPTTCSTPKAQAPQRML